MPSVFRVRLSFDDHELVPCLPCQCQALGFPFSSRVLTGWHLYGFGFLDLLGQLLVRFRSERGPTEERFVKNDAHRPEIHADIARTGNGTKFRSHSMSLSISTLIFHSQSFVTISYLSRQHPPPRTWRRSDFAGVFRVPCRAEILASLSCPHGRRDVERNQNLPAGEAMNRAVSTCD